MARAGLLRTAHGVVRTPAFTPLATKGVVRGIEAHEVAALGYDMVLGNTFHLWLEPGHELTVRLDLLLRTFPIRTCSDNKFERHERQGRPCLLFHIEKCAGPCVKEIDKPAYDELLG